MEKSSAPIAKPPTQKQVNRKNVVPAAASCSSSVVPTGPVIEPGAAAAKPKGLNPNTPVFVMGEMYQANNFCYQ